MKENKLTLKGKLGNDRLEIEPINQYIYFTGIIDQVGSTFRIKREDLIKFIWVTPGRPRGLK